MNSLTDEVPEPDAEGGVTHTISRTVLLLEQNMKLYYTKNKNILSHFHIFCPFSFEILKS